MGMLVTDVSRRLWRMMVISPRLLLTQAPTIQVPSWLSLGQAASLRLDTGMFFCFSGGRGPNLPQHPFLLWGSPLSPARHLHRSWPLAGSRLLPQPQTHCSWEQNASRLPALACLER